MNRRLAISALAGAALGLLSACQQDAAPPPFDNQLPPPPKVIVKEPAQAPQPRPESRNKLLPLILDLPRDPTAPKPDSSKALLHSPDHPDQPTRFSGPSTDRSSLELRGGVGITPEPSQ